MIFSCIVKGSIFKKKTLNKEGNMTIDKLIMRIAGSFILISLLLAWLHSSYWLIFTAFVGANLLQSSFTGFCPMVPILKKFGIEPGKAFD